MILNIKSGFTSSDEVKVTLEKDMIFPSMQRKLICKSQKVKGDAKFIKTHIFVRIGGKWGMDAYPFFILCLSVGRKA